MKFLKICLEVTQTIKSKKVLIKTHKQQIKPIKLIQKHICKN